MTPAPQLEHDAPPPRASLAGEPGGAAHPVDTGVEHRAVRRVARHIAVLAVLSPLASALAGAPGRTTLGVALGGLVAALNFLAVERISGRVVQGTVRTQGLLMGLLVAKMAAVMVLVILLVRTLGVDAIGFVIGLSTLVLGLALEGLWMALGAWRDEPAPATGRELP